MKYGHMKYFRDTFVSYMQFKSSTQVTNLGYKNIVLECFDNVEMSMCPMFSCCGYKVI